MKHNVIIAPERRKDKAGNLIAENVPLFADIRFGGGRMFYFTGYRIDVNNFDKETQQVKKNSSGKEGGRTVPYNIINTRLKAIRAVLELHISKSDSITKTEVKALLDNVCKKAEKKINADDHSFFGMFDSYIKDYVSAASRPKLKSVRNHWKRYEEKNKLKLSFDKITVSTLRDFQKYIENDSETSVKGKVKRAPKGQNTVHRIMKNTRAFWNYAKKELKREGIEINSLFGGEGYKLPREKYGEPIYITRDERNMLFEAVLPTERLMRVRDIFVFQCLIGARVGDMVRLKKTNIINGKISYIPHKTKDEEQSPVKVPLHQQAKEILSRYNIPDGSLLPFISDQRYNDYIKELFEVVGLTRIVTRLNPKTNEEEQVRLCDIASSHMARRTFVGNLYGTNKNDVIASMSGHIPGSKSFGRYYTVSSNLQEEAVNNM